MVAEIWNFSALIWKDDIASPGQEQWLKDKVLLHVIQTRMGTVIKTDRPALMICSYNTNQADNMMHLYILPLDKIQGNRTSESGIV
jgi:hypothetical protein